MAYGRNFKMLTAKISEIFFSIQGEGLYCGQKQVFLRFAGCNLNCAYCDEPAALVKRSMAPFYSHKSQVTGHKQEKKTGEGISDYREISAAAAAAEVIKLARKNRAKAVSLTGGEPLLNWKFIKVLAPALRKAGLAVHLETNGTLYRELLKVKSLVDVIAMDIKLPSSTGQQPFWREHAGFIKAAPEKTFVKVVLTSKTSFSDFKKAVELTASVPGIIPFFLQPATRRPAAVRPPAAGFLEKACCEASAKLPVVRLLPQQHPKWGVK
ncbi:MAG: 7-carboxy-7-deazaguanine synthase QueE [Elusimicrobia bacterium]|nr:7-carboxy-7-deazaguanine synthase QueE [Elusimicrobiota bacterium]